MKVLHQENDVVLGFLVDLTPEGIMLMSESPIEVDRRFHLKIQLRDTGNHEFLNFEAKSKWCKKEMYADFYDTGFELLRIDPEDLKRIESIIEKMCF